MGCQILTGCYTTQPKVILGKNQGFLIPSSDQCFNNSLAVSDEVIFQESQLKVIPNFFHKLTLTFSQ